MKKPIECRGKPISVSISKLASQCNADLEANIVHKVIHSSELQHCNLSMFCFIFQVQDSLSELKKDLSH